MLTCICKVLKLPRLHPLVQRCVPVVLDGIVCAARQVAGQHCPLVADLAVQQHQLLVLLLCPVVAVDVGVQVVDPPGGSSGTNAHTYLSLFIHCCFACHCFACQTCQMMQPQESPNKLVV